MKIWKVIWKGPKFFAKKLNQLVGGVIIRSKEKKSGSASPHEETIPNPETVSVEQEPAAVEANTTEVRPEDLQDSAVLWGEGENLTEKRGLVIRQKRPKALPGHYLVIYYKKSRESVGKYQVVKPGHDFTPGFLTALTANYLGYAVKSDTKLRTQFTKRVRHKDQFFLFSTEIALHYHVEGEQGAKILVENLASDPLRAMMKEVGVQVADVARRLPWEDLRYNPNAVRNALTEWMGGVYDHEEDKSVFGYLKKFAKSYGFSLVDVRVHCTIPERYLSVEKAQREEAGKRLILKAQHQTEMLRKEHETITRGLDRAEELNDHLLEKTKVAMNSVVSNDIRQMPDLLDAAEVLLRFRAMVRHAPELGMAPRMPLPLGPPEEDGKAAGWSPNHVNSLREILEFVYLRVKEDRAAWLPFCFEFIADHAGLETAPDATLAVRADKVRVWLDDQQKKIPGDVFALLKRAVDDAVQLTAQEAVNHD